jgi:hypothetical protein
MSAGASPVPVVTSTGTVRPSATATLDLPSGLTLLDYGPAQAYCKAVGTVDEFDARYTGMVPAKRLSFYTWRCADGVLLECTGGYLIQCLPRKRILDPSYAGFCAQIGTGDPPVGVWAQEYAYFVTCKDGQPVITGEKRLDARGFDTAAWKTIPPGTP